MTMAAVEDKMHVEDNVMNPNWAVIKKIETETVDTSTLWLEFEDEDVRKDYKYSAGQFNMLYLPVYGESAISISSNPDQEGLIGHTIRFVGNVTRAVSRLNVGDRISVRGPFGTNWPVEESKGKDVIIFAGGIGLAPLRPAIYQIINNRQDYGKVTIVYGSRSPADLLYTGEYDEWRTHDIELMVTVDHADDTWDGLVGVVPMYFYRLRPNPENTVLWSCGPEIMMHFVLYEGLARNIPNDQIYLSYERNMKCGVGVCGHCQHGVYYICKDGPIFTYEELEPYFNVEDL